MDRLEHAGISCNAAMVLATFTFLLLGMTSKMNKTDEIYIFTLFLGWTLAALTFGAILYALWNLFKYHGDKND